MGEMESRFKKIYSIQEKADKLKFKSNTCWAMKDKVKKLKWQAAD